MTAKPLKTSRLGNARGFVVFVAAIGLLLQSFITQTHIHFGPQETGGIHRATGHVATSKQAPIDKAAACPFCQAIVHAGAFVAPSAPIVYLSFRWVRTARLAFAASPTSRDVAHDWRSRAPPRS